MTDKLKVGIIGAGGIARGAHLPGYRRVEDRVDIVAIADVVPKKAETAAEEFSIPYTFSDYEDMLREVELDAVSVCTPNKFHAPATIAALEAGCHVLCEKPPALETAEAETMAQTAGEQDRILMYGFHFRYSPEVRALKRFIKAGELGDVYSVTGRWLRRRGIPGGVFVNRELQGGGPLIDLGVHVLDTIMYLLDFPEPELVLGTTYQKIGNQKGVGTWGSWDWKNYTVEDLARGMILFKNGMSLILEASFAANISTNETIDVSLLGDEGGAELFPLGVYKEQHETLVDITPAHLPKQSDHSAEIEDFISCCLEDKTPTSTPEQGIIIQSIIDSFYLSAERKQPVKYSAEGKSTSQAG